MKLFVTATLSVLALGCATTALAAVSPPRTIKVGDTVHGALESNERDETFDWVMDRYNLRATRGQRITITLKSDSFDSYLDLDKGDDHIDDDDDGGNGLDSRLEFEAEETGLYRINVTSSEHDDTGSYTLAVLRSSAHARHDNRDDIDDAVSADDAVSVVAPPRASRPRSDRPAPPPAPIALGQTITGRITASSPRHDDDTPYQGYTFAGKRGQSVVIDMESDDFDAYLVLRRLDEDSQIKTDDDGGEDTNAHLVAVLPADGNYEIRANSIEEDSRGAFTLKLAEGPPRPVSTLAPIALGQTVQGQITASSPLHDDDTPYQGYSFVGKRGQSVAIDMKSKAFDAYLVLRNLDEDSELKTDDDGGEDTDAHLVTTLPADATYEIRANSIEEDSRGAFTLKLAEGPARVAPKAVAIAYGQTVRGELKEGDAQDDEGLWLDLYRFRGKAGDKVTVTLRSEDFDTVATMTAVNGGREIATNDDVRNEPGTDSGLQVTLPADGEYDIQANGQSAGRGGDYILGVSLTPR